MYFLTIQNASVSNTTTDTIKDTVPYLNNRQRWNFHWNKERETIRFGTSFSLCIYLILQVYMESASNHLIQMDLGGATCWLFSVSNTQSGHVYLSTTRQFNLLQPADENNRTPKVKLSFCYFKGFSSFYF